MSVDGRSLAWFDARGSVALRMFTLLLLLLAGSVYMFVWCELYTPRWYCGRLRCRYGLLISNSDRTILD